MEVWTDRVRKELGKTPTGAKPFSQIILALNAEGLPVFGREDWMLRKVREEKEYFRVIPGRLGPWLDWPSGQEATTGPGGSGGNRSDVWVMSCEAPVGSSNPRDWVLGRLKETLQAWGREVDEGSQVSIGRWMAGHAEARRAMERILRARPKGG